MSYIPKTINNNKMIRFGITVTLCLMTILMLGWATYESFGDIKTAKTSQQSSHPTHVNNTEGAETYMPRVYMPDMAE